MSAAAAAAEGLKRFRHGDDDGATGAQRWLVCVDGSEKRLRMLASHYKQSKAALRWALNAMKPETDTLILLSVVELVVHSIPHPSDYFKQLEEHMNKHSTEHAQQVLDGVKQVATSAGAKRVETALLQSKVPKEAIVKYVEENKIDNLVLGRRGMSEAERHIMGSTSDYCIRHAYANVIVVK